MGWSPEPQAACRHPEGSVPNLRPFRALRYEPSRVGDLGAVTAPPYDVIDASTRARLVDRHPANVVRLDLPVEEPGDGPDDRYRRAARTLATWRSDGTLRKDPHPSIYVYEQRYRVPGTDLERTQRGFFARLQFHVPAHAEVKRRVLSTTSNVTARHGMVPPSTGHRRWLKRAAIIARALQCFSTTRAAALIIFTQLLGQNLELLRSRRRESCFRRHETTAE